jgi:hypothetical protein
MWEHMNVGLSMTACPLPNTRKTRKKLRKEYELLPIRPAKKPINLRFILAAAIRKDTRRPASLYDSDISSKGSKNL